MTENDAKELASWVLLLKSCEVMDSLREALAAAAKLLMECKCQEAKRQESLAAVGLADAALDRLEAFHSSVLTIFGKPLPKKAKEAVQ